MKSFLHFQVLKETLLILIEDTERDYKKVFLFPSKRIMQSIHSFIYKDILYQCYRISILDFFSFINLHQQVLKDAILLIYMMFYLGTSFFLTPWSVTQWDQVHPQKVCRWLKAEQCSWKNWRIGFYLEEPGQVWELGPWEQVQV